jgi:hypothetical protein
MEVVAPTAIEIEQFRARIRVRNRCRMCAFLLQIEHCNEHTQDGYSTQDNYWCITSCTGFEALSEAGPMDGIEPPDLHAIKRGALANGATAIKLLMSQAPAR